MVDDRRSGPVSLGCGTLIVIGLIVLIFSGGGRIQNMEDELRNMRTDINNLQVVIEMQNQSIEDQPQEIRELKNAIVQDPKAPQP